MRGYTLLACLLIASFSCSKSSSGLSEEKAKDLTKVIAVFKDLPIDMYASIAAEAIVEIEIDRLPMPLLAVFDAISNADAAMKVMLVSQGLNKSLEAVNTLCKGRGGELLEVLEGFDPHERVGVIRDVCGTDRFELVRNPKPSTDPMTYLLAHVALSELQSKGGASKDETSLLRFLAMAESPPMPVPKEPEPSTPDVDSDIGNIGGQTPGEVDPAPRKGEVKISKVETIGSLEKEIIQRYVRRKIPQLRHCYEQSLVRSPELSGTLNASFTITPTGGVMQSLATGIGDEELEGCMAGALKRTNFPKPTSGGTVDVKFSFELSQI